MTRSRRNVLALMGATALAGCAAPAIVSRGDNDPFEGGIGGTGIVGVVTGFGSILVNGLRVEVTSRTDFSANFGTASLDNLRPGQSVTIAAMRSQEGFVARRVVRDSLLVGLLRDENDSLTVNGVLVLPEGGSLGSGQVGQRVEVSGVWGPSGVIASRIDPVPAGPDIISGTAASGGGLLAIGPTRIETTQPRSRLNGGFVVAIGTMSDGAFKAESVREGRFGRLTSLAQLSVDGFLETTSATPGFRIAGLGHSFARDTRLAEIGARRALYFGRYNGVFGANRGYVTPTNFQLRRNLLNNGFEQPFDGTVLRL